MSPLPYFAVMTNHFIRPLAHSNFDLISSRHLIVLPPTTSRLKEHSAQTKAELTVNGLLVGVSRLFTVVNYDAMANMWHVNI